MDNKELWEKLITSGAENARLLGAVLSSLGIYGIFLCIGYLIMGVNVSTTIATATAASLSLMSGVVAYFIYHLKFLRLAKQK